MKKYVQEMWLIHDVLFFDKEKALETEDGKDYPKLVYVGIDDDGIELDRNGISADYFGAWIYSREDHLRSEVEEYNKSE